MAREKGYEKPRSEVIKARLTSAYKRLEKEQKLIAELEGELNQIASQEQLDVLIQGPVLRTRRPGASAGIAAPPLS